MPTYDYKCSNCESVFECISSMADREYPADCPLCYAPADVLFSPNKNISIPARFALSRHWHLPDTPSPDSGTAAGNNQVHSPKKKSFKQAFDENWSKAGGA